MDIGTIITKYCDEHGMSSTEFANRVGVSRAYIYMLKRGKRYKAEKEPGSIRTVRVTAVRSVAGRNWRMTVWRATTISLQKSGCNLFLMQRTTSSVTWIFLRELQNRTTCLRY